MLASDEPPPHSASAGGGNPPPAARDGRPLLTWTVNNIDRYVVSSSLRPASLDLRRREKLLFSLFSLALQHVIPSHL
ncbi:hypothetical protein CGCF413_v002404 [Colletotrichum fructicola]|nr:hypothetical protein CGCF413_v002404 [Colletotrichum fructicola]